ncbi:SSI family serine proteinase inhibitor [Pseudarthrobacter sp. NPDC092419]|uniref:SSI family serine proteinase inhibitor n=1 Tax=Pseudarthrobacter sp. NPDC092419 TaxID=3364414 RepID=UPI00381FE4E9
MRTLRLHLAFAALAVLLLTSCTGSPGDGSASPSAPPSGASSSPGTTSPPPTGPAPDAESTVPAPSPETPSALPSGPGKGNAELAISVVPDEGQPAVNYTLVCQDGEPAAESQHPSAAAACAALKANAALLAPPAKSPDRACTQQYGGPQKATVSGVVDGVPVETSFSRTDGCEISAWDAAKAVLGPAGGAV